MAESKPCPWCHDHGKPMKRFQLEWSIIDDDFGQSVHVNQIHYCFACGRKLEDSDVQSDISERKGDKGGKDV